MSGAQTTTLEARPLNLGRHEIWPPVVLAPMAGVTDLAYRTLCWEQGAGLCVNQMVSARGLAERHEATMKLAEVGPDEPIRSVQLYATRPEDTTEAVRWLIGELDVDHIDFNFGCPSRKVTRHGGGAALPAKPKLFAAIVNAAVTAAEGRPISVKFRKGISDDLLTFVESGRIAQDAGVAAVALHGRTAEQLYSGRADWQAIGELKSNLQDIPVLGNGDIWIAQDATAMMQETGCDGVVIGRGCLGRPWLFRDLRALFNDEPLPGVP
ncbi:MAG: tRNA dihydrouridine synthase, partial [Acidimicrobiales bacterium]